MEEVGCEVQERGVADVPGVWAAGAICVGTSRALFTRLVLAPCQCPEVSAHRLINRPHGLRKTGLYLLGRLVMQWICHLSTGHGDASGHGTCDNYFLRGVDAAKRWHKFLMRPVEFWIVMFFAP